MKLLMTDEEYAGFKKGFLQMGSLVVMVGLFILVCLCIGRLIHEAWIAKSMYGWFTGTLS